MDDDRFDLYLGRRVAKGWPARIEAAQTETSYVIGGATYPRVRYGDESSDWHADQVPCHDCAVVKGQYHVPSCDVEECPVCGGQVLSCDCEYEGDDEE